MGIVEVVARHPAAQLQNLTHQLTSGREGAPGTFHKATSLNVSILGYQHALLYACPKLLLLDSRCLHLLSWFQRLWLLRTARPSTTVVP